MDSLYKYPTQTMEHLQKKLNSNGTRFCTTEKLPFNNAPLTYHQHNCLEKLVAHIVF